MINQYLTLTEVEEDYVRVLKDMHQGVGIGMMSPLILLMLGIGQDKEGESYGA